MGSRLGAILDARQKIANEDDAEAVNQNSAGSQTSGATAAYATGPVHLSTYQGGPKSAQGVVRTFRAAMWCVAAVLTGHARSP